MESLADKVVLITGASSGIGAGTAEYLAQQKCQLSLTGRDESNLQQTLQKCVSRGVPKDKILAISGDLTVPEDRQLILQKTIDQFGRLDVLVNNAAISIVGTTESTTYEQFDKLIDTNVKSLFFLTQLAFPHLCETKGNIVNISSECARDATPECTVYCMSKAAVESWTKCMAVEFAPKGVRANAVSPGVIQNTRIATRGAYIPTAEETRVFTETQTSRQPLGVGEALDVAKSVAFLASDMASHITGEVISVDGGRHNVCARLFP